LFQETSWDKEFVAAMKDVKEHGTNALNRPLRPMYANAGNAETSPTGTIAK